jgi:nucleoside phosphorylase
MSKFAIFIALPEELEAAISVLSKYGSLDGDMSDVTAGQRIFDYQLKSPKGPIAGEVYLIRGMGNTKSAAFVGSSLDVGAPPKHALLIGISGSLSPKKVGLGHVVMSSHVKHYSPDKVKRFNSKELKEISSDSASDICDPKSSTQSSDFQEKGKILVDGRDKILGGSHYRYLRQRIFRNNEQRELKKFLKSHGEKIVGDDGNDYKLHHGAILGSNMVIDSEEYVEYLMQKNFCDDVDFYKLNDPNEHKERCVWDSSELLAVDMESYGFFSAFSDFQYYSSSVRAVAFRGISDLAFGKADLDGESKGSHRRQATKNAVETALKYLHDQYEITEFNLPTLAAEAASNAQGKAGD